MKTQHTHIPHLSNCKDTGVEPYFLDNSKHTHATLYIYGTIHIKEHRSKKVQPNGSHGANNHCSTRYEKNFRHNKLIHTYHKAVTDKHSRRNYKGHCKLYQGTQSLYNIHKPHIHARQFKTGVPQGGVLSPTLFNIYTTDLSPPILHIHTGSETDTHAYCISGRVAERNGLSYNTKQWENSLYMTKLQTKLSMHTSKHSL